MVAATKDTAVEKRDAASLLLDAQARAHPCLTVHSVILAKSIHRDFHRDLHPSLRIFVMSLILCGTKDESSSCRSLGSDLLRCLNSVVSNGWQVQQAIIRKEFEKNSSYQYEYSLNIPSFIEFENNIGGARDRHFS